MVEDEVKKGSSAQYNAVAAPSTVECVRQVAWGQGQAWRPGLVLFSLGRVPPYCTPRTRVNAAVRSWEDLQASLGSSVKRTILMRYLWDILSSKAFYAGCWSIDRVWHLLDGQPAISRHKNTTNADVLRL